MVHHTANTSDAHVDRLCTSVGCHFSLLATSLNAGSSLCHSRPNRRPRPPAAGGTGGVCLGKATCFLLNTEKSALLKVVDNHIQLGIQILSLKVEKLRWTPSPFLIPGGTTQEILKGLQICRWRVTLDSINLLGLIINFQSYASNVYGVSQMLHLLSQAILGIETSTSPVQGTNDLLKVITKVSLVWPGWLDLTDLY